MNCRGLLKKHFWKKNLNICSETAKIANFHFSHYKSMETISFHSNQGSYQTGTKNTIKLFVPLPQPIDALCRIWKESASWLQRISRLKMLMDDDLTDSDGCLPILLFIFFHFPEHFVPDYIQ